MDAKRLVTIITAAATPHIGSGCAGELARNVAQCMVGGIPLADALTSCVAHRRRTPEYGWAPLTGQQAASLLAAIMDAVLEEQDAETCLARWVKRIARGEDPEVTVLPVEMDAAPAVHRDAGIVDAMTGRER